MKHGDERICTVTAFSGQFASSFRFPNFATVFNIIILINSFWPSVHVSSCSGSNNQWRNVKNNPPKNPKNQDSSSKLHFQIFHAPEEHFTAKLNSSHLKPHAIDKTALCKTEIQKSCVPVRSFSRQRVQIISKAWHYILPCRSNLPNVRNLDTLYVVSSD